MIEEKFNVVVVTEEISEIKTIGDIAILIEKNKK